ncbi:mitotic-spindle organizing protein 2B isoform X1 [Rhinatrema bivittatum]|uniref:mitotic-spindle organizing protein 2B isoform X1 n=1 Tax=Rhinatrema bivittatum TaxID=194408 RepID=UPI00112739AC|nr:mitotic-spindle organizing protein 2B isoform X1 [Rhinatrema bivittatum]
MATLQQQGMGSGLAVAAGGGGGGPGMEQVALVAAVSGSLQKYALKKKKMLNAEEAELYELAQSAGITMDQEVFKILVDLLKMNVAPLAVFQMLKSMCAGHKLVDTSSAETNAAAAPATLLDARGRNKPSAAISGTPIPSERSSSRECSGQRMPRQTSATRLQKSGSSGKTSGSGSS